MTRARPATPLLLLLLLLPAATHGGLLKVCAIRAVVEDKDSAGFGHSDAYANLKLGFNPWITSPHISDTGAPQWNFCSQDYGVAGAAGSVLPTLEWQVYDRDSSSNPLGNDRPDYIGSGLVPFTLSSPPQLTEIINLRIPCCGNGGYIDLRFDWRAGDPCHRPICGGNSTCSWVDDGQFSCACNPGFQPGPNAFVHFSNDNCVAAPTTPSTSPTTSGSTSPSTSGSTSPSTSGSTTPSTSGSTTGTTSPTTTGSTSPTTTTTTPTTTTTTTTTVNGARGGAGGGAGSTTLSPELSQSRSSSGSSAALAGGAAAGGILLLLLIVLLVVFLRKRRSKAAAGAGRLQSNPTYGDAASFANPMYTAPSTAATSAPPSEGLYQSLEDQEAVASMGPVATTPGLRDGMDNPLYQLAADETNFQV